jgi:hypothetical protein
MKKAESQGRMMAGWAAAGMLIAAFSVLATGCQESNPLTGAKLYPVKGKVLLADGKPLTTGSVVFVATKSTVTSTADIESDGTYSVKGGGLPEGEYRVRIEAPATKASNRKAPTGTLPYAAMYLDEDSSKLTATVTPDEGKNNFEFKLDGKDSSPNASSARGR